LPYARTDCWRGTRKSEEKTSPRVSSIIDTLVDTPKIIQLLQEKILKCRMHVQTVGEVPENLKKKTSPGVSSIIDTLVDTPKIIQQEKNPENVGTQSARLCGVT
jgi:hypothetical protein